MGCGQRARLAVLRARRSGEQWKDGRLHDAAARDGAVAARCIVHYLPTTLLGGNPFAHAQRKCKSCSRNGAATAMQCRAEHVHRAAAGPIPEVPGRRAPLTPLYKHPCSPVRVRGPIFRLPLQPHLRRCRREAICLSSFRARRLHGAGSCPFRPPQAWLRPETALPRSSPSGRPSTIGRPGSSA